MFVICLSPSHVDFSSLFSLCLSVSYLLSASAFGPIFFCPPVSASQLPSLNFRLLVFLFVHNFKTLLSMQTFDFSNLSNLTYTLRHYSIPLSSMTTGQLTTAIKDFISKVTSKIDTVRMTIICSSYIAMDRSGKMWTLFCYKIKSFGKCNKNLALSHCTCARRNFVVPPGLSICVLSAF